MTTSQKHQDFMAKPMGEKQMGSLAGIGEVLGKNLEERGFDKLFRKWLKDTCGAIAKQSWDSFEVVQHLLMRLSGEPPVPSPSIESPKFAATWGLLSSPLQRKRLLLLYSLLMYKF
ncbi:unnamed protein product [Nyctereutes procyonoides]|uniref:Barrier-to-autointegration factor n=1 Tax=Nyctereutes procyonoides TaxID=34880 RepID=A0A811Y6N0_NYCPR|nr:unnamed protein product [Nyctereutes procyonoides]